jgi:hypothetical protein
MNIIEPRGSESICDVNSAAAHLRWQANFFEALELRQLLRSCNEEVWSMPVAEQWRHTLLAAIRSVELHCDSLRAAAAQLDRQTFTEGSNGSTWW